MSQHLIPPAVLMCLGVLVEAQLEDSTLTDRAYVVLEKQNLGKFLQRDAVWAWCWPNTLQKIICSVLILTRQPFLFNESCGLEPVVSLLLCVIQSVVLPGGSVRTVTLGSVLGVLLLLMIIMAVCVYKPLSRRWSTPGRRSRQRPRRGDGPGNAPAPRREERHQHREAQTRFDHHLLTGAHRGTRGALPPTDWTLTVQIFMNFYLSFNKDWTSPSLRHVLTCTCTFLFN